MSFEFYGLGILLLGPCMFLLSWLLLFHFKIIYRPLRMTGIMFLDSSSEQEKVLRSQIPDLQYHWDEWHRLLHKIARQRWQEGELVQPDQLIRAFFYRFIIPWACKKMQKMCEKHKNDYEMLLKLHITHKEEESFTVYC